MSRIKNTRELVLRAQGHARLDHIKQGCAIGCLSTPHRQSELRSFIKRLGWFDGDEYELHENASAQLVRLRQEFGICPALARCAEAIFEGLEHHGEAINFIPALRQGAARGGEHYPEDGAQCVAPIGAGQRDSHMGRRLSRASR